MSKITNKQLARAIYSLAKQSALTDQIISDLESVFMKLNESPSFLMHLRNHKLSLKNKEEDLKKVFLDFISKRTYRIILLIIKEKKIGELDKIIKEIKEIKKTDDEIVDARIYVPFPLDETRKAKIKSILQNKTSKQIIIHEIIDKNIIGSAKIDLRGLVIDGSLSGRIEKLKNNIKNIE